MNNDARAFFFIRVLYVRGWANRMHGYSVKILFMIVIVIGFVAPKEGTE